MWIWITMVQVIASCLTAPSYYLNQRQLIIKGVLWHSPKSSLLKVLNNMCLKIILWRLWPDFSGANGPLKPHQLAAICIQLQNNTVFQLLSNVQGIKSTNPVNVAWFYKPSVTWPKWSHDPSGHMTLSQCSYGYQSAEVMWRDRLKLLLDWYITSW